MEQLEKHILSLYEHQEDIIWVKGRPFLISPATEDDIERVATGTIVMD